jgi:hypothetical protein
VVFSALDYALMVDQVKADDLTSLLCPQKYNTRNFEESQYLSLKTTILVINEI